MFAITIYSCVFGLIYFAFYGHATSTGCLPRKTKYGSVCVCTASYCDYLENPEPIAKDVVVVTSSEAGQRFAVNNLRFSEKTINESNAEERLFRDSALIVDARRKVGKILSKAKKTLNYIFPANKGPFDLSVDRSVEYQKITGFGGAFTGSVSYLLEHLDPQLQDHIYKSYYHKDGLGFNLLRTSIGGCDFDLAPWAYNELPQKDVQLSNFTKLDPRDITKIKQIERMKLVSELDELKIMAAAWSSPTWMKSNDKWTGFGTLKKDYYKAWADYHLKFLELMDAANMPVWAISTGNEPTNGVVFFLFVHFMSLGWTPSDQAIWLNDYLGPAITNSKYKDTLIFGNDDQRFSFPAWFEQMNKTRPGVLNYLDGFAVHWYWDDVILPKVMDKTVQEIPGKIVLITESCIGDKPWETHGPELGSWKRGEKYARDFLHNLQHSYNGWIDWNLILDEQGGPNYAHNYVDSAVIVNATNRAEIYKQPIFYAMGHFSKFIPKGSVLIEAKISSSSTVEVVAFKRPDGRIVVVVLNSNDNAVDVLLNDTVNGGVNINIPANSWNTIIYA